LQNLFPIFVSPNGENAFAQPRLRLSADR